MSYVAAFWSCDYCEEEGRLVRASWKVALPSHSAHACERHANEFDPDHRLRIGAILEDVVRLATRSILKAGSPANGASR